jgi:hypothetical protein
MVKCALVLTTTDALESVQVQLALNGRELVMSKVLWNDFTFKATVVSDSKSAAIGVPTNDVTALVL